MLQLEIIRNILRHDHTAHVGGSIGLMLHGVKLNRDLSNSDIDITTAQGPTEKTFTGVLDVEEFSNAEDFEHAFKVIVPGGSVKVEFRRDKSQTYESKEYGGYIYRVTSIYTILRYKAAYAEKGNPKHRSDIQQLLNVVTTDIDLNF